MTETSSATRVSAEQARQLVSKGALLVDVRSPLGRGRDGEIEGAIVVAKPDVLDILSRRLRPTSDDQKIVVFCGSVNGSGPVIEALTTAGFDNVVDVQGGFSALRAAGLAVRLPPTPAG